MPELPEVETICRSIKSYLVGKTILYIIVYNGSLRWPVSNEIRNINNKFVFSIKRRAKYLLLELSDGWIMIHLGMSGSLRIVAKELALRKHDHIDLCISSGKILRYTDPRRFGSWLWVKNLKEHKLLRYLGPEPLSKNFNTSYLKIMCERKKIAIKPWLMNNQLVVGLGNIYANESLFIAKIHPNRLALSLSQEECELLVNSIKRVLQFSIDRGGATLRNFVQCDGKSGFFTQKLQVYGRKGKPCYVCNTLVSITKHRQRTTFYCHNCQK